MPNPILLILTVGTGTAGPNSFIAEGAERAFNAIGDVKKVLSPLILPVSSRFPSELTPS